MNCNDLRHGQSALRTQWGKNWVLRYLDISPGTALNLGLAIRFSSQNQTEPSGARNSNRLQRVDHQPERASRDHLGRTSRWHEPD